MHRLSEADKLIARIRGLNYDQMLQAASEELQSARQRPRAQQRDSSYPHYLEFLQGVRWFLQTGSRPSNFDDYDFSGMLPLAENLVKKGQWKSEALAQFGRP